MAPSLLYLAGKNCSVWLQRENTVDLLSFVFHRDNPMIHVFNGIREKLTESGVVYKLVEKYESGRLCEMAQPRAGVSPIPLEPIFGALFLLLLGCGVGFVVLCGEHGWKKHKTMKEYVMEAQRSQGVLRRLSRGATSFFR